LIDQIQTHFPSLNRSIRPIFKKTPSQVNTNAVYSAYSPQTVVLPRQSASIERYFELTGPQHHSDVVIVSIDQILESRSQISRISPSVLSNALVDTSQFIHLSHMDIAHVHHSSVTVDSDQSIPSLHSPVFGQVLSQSIQNSVYHILSSLSELSHMSYASIEPYFESTDISHHLDASTTIPDAIQPPKSCSTDTSTLITSIVQVEHFDSSHSVDPSISHPDIVISAITLTHIPLDFERIISPEAPRTSTISDVSKFALNDIPIASSDSKVTIVSNLIHIASSDIALALSDSNVTVSTNLAGPLHLLRLPRSRLPQTRMSMSAQASFLSLQISYCSFLTRLPSTQSHHVSISTAYGSSNAT
jgi:hypothetical protein